MQFHTCISISFKQFPLYSARHMSWHLQKRAYRVEKDNLSYRARTPFYSGGGWLINFFTSNFFLSLCHCSCWNELVWVYVLGTRGRGGYAQPWNINIIFKKKRGGLYRPFFLSDTFVEGYPVSLGKPQKKYFLMARPQSPFFTLCLVAVGTHLKKKWINKN